MRNGLTTRFRAVIRNLRQRWRRPALKDRLAPAYLRGRGIEIGALFNPQPLPRGARVRYVDRMPVADLRKQYPDLADQPLVPVHIIDNGETLATIVDGSQDFVIANHFLEHCEDPIGALGNMIRVLRPGGVLHLAIPDKRFTFDRDRPLTTLAHLQADHEHGPAATRPGHYAEYVRFVHKPASKEIAEVQSADLMRRGYSIHFHVWTQREILELLLHLAPALSFDIEAACRHDYEFVVVLRKHERLAA